MTEPTGTSTEHGKQKEFHFTHSFDAPRSQVFQAWTDGMYLEQLWGPHNSVNPVRKWEAFPGGLIHIDMIASDGSVHPMHGNFTEFISPERIVFTSTAFPDEGGIPRFVTLNSVTFTEEMRQTTVAVHSVVVKAFSGVLQALDGIETGWTQSLERLSNVVEKI